MRIDARRSASCLLFVVCGALLVGAAWVGGTWLTIRTGARVNAYGKSFLALCMLAIPPFHPAWRESSRDKAQARAVLRDTALVWLIGFGGSTVAFFRYRPVPYTAADLPRITIMSLFLAAFSAMFAGGIAVFWQAAKATWEGRDPSLAVERPLEALFPTERKSSAPIGSERWLALGGVVLFGAAALHSLRTRQDSMTVAFIALTTICALALPAPPVGRVRRLCAFACLGLMFTSLAALLVLS